MCCSCIKTGLVIHKHLPASRRSAAGFDIQDRELPHFSYPCKINRCVLDSSHLLFGRFPFKVLTQHRPVLPRPLDCEAVPQLAIMGLEALLPDGFDARELNPLAWLA